MRVRVILDLDVDSDAWGRAWHVRQKGVGRDVAQEVQRLVADAGLVDSVSLVRWDSAP